MRFFLGDSGADKGAEAESSLKVKAGLLPTAGRALRTQTSVILTVTEADTNAVAPEILGTLTLSVGAVGPSFLMAFHQHGQHCFPHLED